MKFFALCILSVAMATAQTPAEAALRNTNEDTIQTKVEGGTKVERNLQDGCGGCDYANDPVCARCLHMENLIVACGDCLYTNECFAIEAGQDATECVIVGDV